MRKLVGYAILYFCKFLLKLRYRVKYKGLENLNPEKLTRSGGTLFIPNHVAMFVDPALIALPIWKNFPIRPLIVEYMYYAPGIYPVMKYMNALPVPDNESSSNTLKRSKSEKVMKDVSEGLKKGDNFLIYPSGRLKTSAKEVVGGASGAHQILSETPEANVVLVRITGLWGSMFSRALIGKSPPLFPMLLEGAKIALKNFLFFTPKREVTVEYYLPGDDLPRDASRLELNRYLENWYNQPPEGEELKLISYSMWKEELPEPYPWSQEKKDEKIDLEAIPDSLKKKVTQKLTELTHLSAEEIKPTMNLSRELGLDSLDMGELVVFLEDEFDVRPFSVVELTTVQRMMGIANGDIELEVIEEDALDLSKWKEKIPHERIHIAEGETIPEVFLNSCAKHGKAFACGDMRAGALTYSSLKMRVILLAEYLRKLPGDHIGILLPSTVAATACFLACQLAGKVPVMINWTVGPRHLKTVLEAGKIEVVLSSWAFLDKLVNVDLTCIEKELLMLEDVKRKLTLFAKIRAVLRSKKSTKSIMKTFGVDKLKAEDRAVLLFTSGTESMPKGVPLSHKNMLTNQKDGCEAVELYADDVFYAILPPFHAFGLTISSLLGLLTGMRVVYHPDPTDGKAMAKGVARWGVTLVCGAPTFLKSMLAQSTKESLKSLRLLVTGAEKAPPELFEKAKELEIGDCVLEGYGITECSPVLTINRPGVPAAGVGQPLNSVELCVVHPETLELLPQGTRGLILARGPNVFSGYLGTDVASPFTTLDGKEWYKTGDLGHLDEMNRLIISGRQKRFIKIGGEMVSLASIETALLQIAPKMGWKIAEEGPSLAICAKEIPGEKPRIYLFSKFDAEIDQINRSLKEEGFSNIVKVSDAHALEEIPIMGTGKINYRALEEQFLV